MLPKARSTWPSNRRAASWVFILEGDGGPKPYRVHYRTPSFVNLQIMPLLARGHFVADLVGIIGSIDIVLGDADR